jgi:AcrR family transcriptional regulator
MDRRTKKTKSAIKEALFAIMGQLPLNQITVKNIIDAADVSRSTFYLHFTDVLDLYHQSVDEILIEMKNQLEFKDRPKTNSDFQLFLTGFFNYAIANQSVLIILLKANDDYFVEQLTPFFIRNTIRLKHLNPDDLVDYYRVVYAVTGTIGVLSDWLLHGTMADTTAISAAIQPFFDLT